MRCSLPPTSWKFESVTVFCNYITVCDMFATFFSRASFFAGNFAKSGVVVIPLIIGRDICTDQSTFKTLGFILDCLSFLLQILYYGDMLFWAFCFQILDYFIFWFILWLEIFHVFLQLKLSTSSWQEANKILNGLNLHSSLLINLRNPSKIART